MTFSGLSVRFCCTTCNLILLNLLGGVSYFMEWPIFWQIVETFIRENRAYFSKFTYEIRKKGLSWGEGGSFIFSGTQCTFIFEMIC